ncbi:MAG: MFS transporter [Calditrichaceae bacterium]|nr:MFS transporter [Calditrichaceae bacterium]MBN2708343.1 MFS transporter [Calditrichaceae bacterium]RQV95230.1 MAG: MFS transporter [Calditrichota bacterium]
MTDIINHMNPEKTKVGYFRWMIVLLIFLATTINYIDRQVIGILAPDLKKAIGWSEIEYGYIVTAFTAAYAIGLPLMGKFIDWIGTKIGYAFALTGWSLAAIGHALARSVFGFGFARFTLGLFEAGNFPAAIKTVAEWFPKKERALATGLFNAGSNVGAIVAPLVVPWITLTWGWQEAFIFTGAIGLLWLLLWFWLYEKPEQHKRLSKPEYDYIQSDPADPVVKIPWRTLFKYRGTWAFALGKLLTDPAWWFYLYWIPSFLFSTYGISLSDIGIPLIIIYVMADVGSIGGGWLSSFLIKKGWSINKGRKVTMLICAIMVLPIVFASQASNVWIAVAFLSLATAAHQGWSANLFTTVSDIFPRKAVGSVVGLGGTFGSIGGMIIATATGFILEFTGSYLFIFIIAGSLYLLALLVINLLVPEIKEIDLNTKL